MSAQVARNTLRYLRERRSIPNIMRLDSHFYSRSNDDCHVVPETEYPGSKENPIISHLFLRVLRELENTHDS